MQQILRRLAKPFDAGDVLATIGLGATGAGIWHYLGPWPLLIVGGLGATAIALRRP